MKALLIDPVLERRQHVAQALQRQGFDVAAFEEPEAACAAQRAECHPLVILAADPWEKGLQGCRQLRGEPGDRPFWVLALAGACPADRVEDLLAAGADDVLPLPLDDRHLDVRLALAKQRIESLIGGKLLAERRRAEAAGNGEEPPYRRSDAEFLGLIENMPDLVAILDADGILRFINRAPPPLSRKEVLGTHCTQYVAPHHVQPFQRAIKRSLDTRTVQAIPVADHEGRWWQLRLVPIGHPESADTLLAIGTDMTERQRAVDLLRAGELRYRLIAENVSDLIWSTEFPEPLVLPERLEPDAALALAAALMERWRFTYASPSVERMLGYEVREFMAMGLKQLFTSASYALAQQAVAEELILETMPGADPRRAREFQIEQFAKDGHVCYCEARASFLRNAQGRATGVLGVTRDVTEKKRVDAEMQKEQDLLRHVLELSERERELVAFEIHDGVAQQLTGALLNFEASAELLATAPTEAQRTYREGVRLLRQSIEESRRLIAGLRPPVLDAFGIVPAIEHLIRENLAAGGPDVELIAAEQVERLARPVEDAVFRIVQESLTNARRHSQSKKVRVELRHAAGRIHFSVHDWGIGFYPERVSPESFGLRGIRERARLLGGSALIDTAPGKGTCVTVDLPLVLETHQQRRT